MKHPRRTSYETYLQIKSGGLLSRTRWLVYEWLYRRGPATGAEVNYYLTHRYNSGDRRQAGYHKRLSELKDKGVVYEVEERICQITGRNAIAWDVTDKLPKEGPKRPQRPSRADFAEAVQLFEAWAGIAHGAMFVNFERPSPAVNRVLTWLRRKSL